MWKESILHDSFHKEFVSFCDFFHLLCIVQCLLEKKHVTFCVIIYDACIRCTKALLIDGLPINKTNNHFSIKSINKKDYNSWVLSGGQSQKCGGVKPVYACFINTNFVHILVHTKHAYSILISYIKHYLYNTITFFKNMLNMHENQIYFFKVFCEW